jgi:hypothetical protein
MLTGAQTIDGIKTFSVSPIVPTATAADQAVNKGQLDSGLAGKANTSHTHAIANVTGLQAALDAKAATSHSHAIADVTGLQSALDARAPLASPALTGTPTAPTAAGGTNTTQIATTAFVMAAMAGAGAGDVIGPASATDDSFAMFDGVTGKLLKSTSAVAISKITGLQSALDARAPLASPALTGTPTAPTAAGGTNTTQIATTAFVTAGLAGKANTSHSHAIADTTGLQAALDAKAPLASPALTGTPTAPTAAASTNTTQIATTAFVQAVVAGLIDAAPGALNTLNELAAALGDDPNFATTITNAVNSRLASASNLSDLTNAAAARGNLGLGSMATQNAGGVNITGGTIAGVTITAEIDGGTF